MAHIPQVLLVLAAFVTHCLAAATRRPVRTSTTAAQSSGTSSGGGSTSRTDLIVGLTLGGLAVVAMVASFAVCHCYRHKSCCFTETKEQKHAVPRPEPVVGTVVEVTRSEPEKEGNVLSV